MKEGAHLHMTTSTFDAVANYTDNNLEQLREADPQVFTQEYPRIAQRNEGRQPILVDSAGQPLDGFPGTRKFIGQPVCYRGHYYASVNETHPFVKLSIRTNVNRLEMPLCFRVPSAAQRAARKSNIVKLESFSSPAPAENVLYVSMRDRRFIPAGRYGNLPEQIAELLNVDPDMNSTTTNGCIRPGTGFNAYLRKGTSSKSTNDAFINAISDSMGGSPILPSTSEGGAQKEANGEFRQVLINKLTPEIFSTLSNGNVKNRFQRMDGSDPYANFIECLRNEYIDEDSLWDFVTRPGVLSPAKEQKGLTDGLNLIIFEANLKADKSISSITLKRPIGFGGLRANWPSLILYKYGGHYEPIYRVFEKDNAVLEERFVPPNFLNVVSIANAIDKT